MEPPQGERATGREIEGLLVELQKAVRAVSFYPANHPALAKIIQQTFTPFGNAAHEHGEFSFGVTRAGIWYEEKIQSPENENVKTLAKFLFQRRIKKLFFLDGLSVREWYQFLKALSSDAEEMYLRGGLEKLLKESRLTHVFVNDVDLQYLKNVNSQPEVPELPLPEEEEPEEDAADEGEADIPGLAEATELSQDGYRTEADDEDTEFKPEVTAALKRLELAPDADIYYEAALSLVDLATQVQRGRKWSLLFKIIEAFEKDAHDPEAGVETKKYAIRALRKVATPQLVRALLKELATDDKSESEVESLLRILSKFGTVTLETLYDRLRTPIDEYSERLFGQLVVRTGAPALSMVASLCDPAYPAPTARLAAHAIGGLKLAEGVAPLSRLLSHPDTSVVIAAVDGLLEIRDHEALNVLGRYLSSDNPVQIRRHILDNVGMRKEARITPLLLDLFRRAEDFELTPDLRKSLNIALARIGGKPVLESLIEVLKARKFFGPLYDKQTLLDAMKILGVAGDRDALNALRGSVKFKESELQQQLQSTCETLDRRFSAPAPATGGIQP